MVEVKDCNCVETGNLCEKCAEQYELENIFEVVTFFYDSESGELVHNKTDFNIIFDLESTLMQADILKDIYEVVVNKYNKTLEESEVQTKWNHFLKKWHKGEAVLVSRKNKSNYWQRLPEPRMKKLKNKRN
tara:strand:- start:706 stop:1098 length:393 start_codon:yes stop_codon:yes gene_type:complete